MPRSVILEPLKEANFNEDELKEMNKHYDQIKNVLDEIKYGQDIAFDTFLKKLKLTEDQYLKAIRYSLKHPTLFLKRSPFEIRINNYNPHLLKAWRANMDLQFVLDSYACAVYILSYITKGQRGMSKLLETASQEANSGNRDIVNKVRHIGNKFLNAVEISAQEAVYLVLQMPMRRASREFQFINTSDPEESTFLLKTIEKIKELPDKSTDIESDNVLKRYQRRPRKLELLCLANFVAWFNCVNDNSRSHIVQTKSDGDFLPETDFHDNVDENDEIDDTTEYQLKGGMKLVKRKKAKIIRSVRFNKENDPENYYGEQFMLYTPWRNKEKDLIKDCKAYQERYKQVEEIAKSTNRSMNTTLTFLTKPSKT